MSYLFAVAAADRERTVTSIALTYLPHWAGMFMFAQQQQLFRCFVRRKAVLRSKILGYLSAHVWRKLTSSWLKKCKCLQTIWSTERRFHRIDIFRKSAGNRSALSMWFQKRGIVDRFDWNAWNCSIPFGTHVTIMSRDFGNDWAYPCKLSSGHLNLLNHEHLKQ